MKKKSVALLMALVLVVGGVIGGTLAWLMDTTDPVVNTFTPAGIEITLTETPNTNIDDSDNTNDTWTAHLVPGKEYAKNPVVSVVRPDTDVDVYLFVTFDPTTSATYLNYTSNLDGNGWTKLQEGVYYRTVAADATEVSWHLLAGDKVTVKPELTEEQVQKAATFTMTYKAYAIQTEGFADAAAAWTEVSKLG